MRRHRATGMLSLSTSELMAAAEAGVPIKTLFAGNPGAHKRVTDAIEKRAMSRESCGIPHRAADALRRTAERTANEVQRAAIWKQHIDAILARVAADDLLGNPA